MMTNSDIPGWALPLFQDVAAIKQMIKSHIDTHKNEHNGEVRHLLILGVGMGAGLAGVGTGLLKLLGV